MLESDLRNVRKAYDVYKARIEDTCPPPVPASADAVDTESCGLACAKFAAAIDECDPQSPWRQKVWQAAANMLLAASEGRSVDPGAGRADTTGCLLRCLIASATPVSAVFAVCVATASGATEHFKEIYRATIEVFTKHMAPTLNTWDTTCAKAKDAAGKFIRIPTGWREFMRNFDPVDMFIEILRYMTAAPTEEPRELALFARLAPFGKCTPAQQFKMMHAVVVACKRAPPETAFFALDYIAKQQQPSSAVRDILALHIADALSRAGNRETACALLAIERDTCMYKTYFRLKRTLVHGEGVLPAETLAANAKRARILEETLLSADDAA